MYLSGKNGHGKSAILDAMTWAVWGQARKTINAVKPDQGLLRLGATQMMVIFDFVVNGQLYRVKREFIQASAKQLAYLEFGMINDDGSIVPLTDKTIRATQDVIERTIRLDYESFVNSAFLRQGHANEFSKKSPKDRKEIVSTILGLQQFDVLKRRALEHAKEAIEQRNTLQAIQETLIKQIPNAEELAQQIAAFNVQVCHIQEQDKALADEKQRFDAAYAAYTVQQKEYERAQFTYEQEHMLYQKQLDLMRGIWKRWRTIQAKFRTMPDYRLVEKEKVLLAGRMQTQQQILQKRLALQEASIQAKEVWEKRQRELERKHAQESQNMEVALERMRLEKKIIEQNIKIVMVTQNEHDNALRAYATELEKLAQSMISASDLAKMELQFQKRKDIYQQWVAKINWLKAEHENLAHKTTVTQNNDPSCPLCEQNLTAARRKFLAQRFARQTTFIYHQSTRLQAIVIRLKQLLIEQHHYLAAAKEINTKKEAIEKEIALLQQKKQESNAQYEAMKKNLQQCDATVHEQESQLKLQREKAGAVIAQDVDYKAKKDAVDAIEKELLSCMYDVAAHQALQKQYEAISKQLADLVEINHEMLNQAARYQEVVLLATNLKQQKKAFITSIHMQQQRDAVAKAAIHITEWAARIEKMAAMVQATKEKLREEQGRIKTTQEHIARIEKEQSKHKDMMQALHHEIEDYQTIAAAAGKDGIQALLIEEAIPEIEQETNYLLSKLTNNQAHILIESLRDLKGGGSKETLDINISDPSGIRPYEMFSGGEAFRIDFALRIAISKLLARRAGTSLQTLIIDEGFGSQDEEGLSLIMDAIYKVQSDFQKVIVVSHLPSMKDQFPVHFMVEKGPNGSKISIMEQG
jgi:exonuclease SbcC